MINVRTKSLITKAVKKTGREPVVKPDMLTLVLRGGCMPLQIGVLMINLMASAVALRLQPDARPITKLLVILPAALPVPILAVTPVIAAVMILVLAAQRTIPVLMPVQPNADRLVVTVKTVLQEVVLTPVHTPVLLSAEAVITAPIPVVPVRSLYLVLGMKTEYAFLPPNVEQAVTNADIILTVPLLLNLVLTDVPLIIPATSALPVSQNRRFLAPNITLTFLDA